MRTLVLLLVLAAAADCCSAADTISLAGKWRFALDRTNSGITERWFEKDLADMVTLPGSTDTNGKGTANTRLPDFAHLSRLYEYTGAAWYQREITIPREWTGKRITLFLERCHWETQVWLDGKPCGMQESLCTPHTYELGSLTPGVHRLAVRVDNTIKYNIGIMGHSITEETQTNWNGIIGRIELRATPAAWIDSVQVYPDVANGSIRVRASIGGDSSLTAGIRYDVLRNGKPVATKTVQNTEATISLGSDVKLWDEFSPNLYTLKASLADTSYSTTFGMRDFRVRDKRLVMNGRRIFLRGTLECCIFPKTGYPPTDVDSWLRILKICKSYGLNHMRFHSWCPPEAAFEAADRMGILFQVELPQWIGNPGKEPAREQFFRDEEIRILDAYGNHPSFGMLCMGNEIYGDLPSLQPLVTAGQQTDPRHLYCATTWRMFGEHDDYNVGGARGVRGPQTDHDFSEPNSEFAKPVITHEVGQWTVFPNMAEIPKYTGVTRPHNFEMIRDMLAEHGILDQAPMFTRASGKLAVELYKEEMEVLLRTPGHAGFQLLDLHDFPGQGTSLIGILDPFWDSKGLIKPEDWRRFCGPVVPLLRMSKRVWTEDETFSAKAQVAQFGPRDLDGIPEWTVTYADGRVLASGTLPAKKLPTGDLYDLGSISVPLADVTAPAKLVVTVSLKGTEASNSWEIWVYPSKVDVTPPADVVVTRSTADVVSALVRGNKVLLLPSEYSLADPGQGSFKSVFWNPVMFPRDAKKGEGILCDPKHPALAEFPTEYYTNWQWYDLLEKSSNMSLDGTPKSFRPIVQVIDNFIKSRKMGNLIEARVGRGRLMVCSMNLSGDLSQRPAARQMMKSVLDYMASPKFQPKQALTFTDLGSFLAERKPTAMHSLGAKVVHVDSEDAANPAVNAIDDDPDTIWHTEWQDANPPFPHEIVIDMQKSVGLAGFKYLPRQDIENGWFSEYEFYVSEDGKSWGTPVSKGTFPADNKEKVVRFDKPCRGRFVRLVALKGFNDRPWAGIAEFDVLLAD